MPEDIILNMFKLQLRDYIYLWTYTPSKGIEAPYLSAMGFIVSLLFFYGFGIKLLLKVWYAIKQRNQTNKTNSQHDILVN